MPGIEMFPPLKKGDLQESLKNRKSKMKTIKLLLACVVVLVVSYFYLSYYRDVFYTLYADEGYIIYGAKRILEGQILYKDFFQFYPPGDFYLLALMFKLFGYSFAVARETAVIINSMISTLLFYLGYKAIKSWHAILLPFFLVRIGFLNFMQYSHYWSSMLFLFLSLVFFLNYLEKHKNTYLYLTGFFIGITGLFLQTTGVYAALLFLLVLVLEKRKEEGFAKQLILFAISISIPLLVAFGYIVYQGAFVDFIKEQYFMSKVYGVGGTLNPIAVYFKDFGPESVMFLLYTATAIICGIILIFFRKRISNPLKIIFMGDIILFLNTITRIDYLHILINSALSFVVVLLFVKWMIGNTKQISTVLYRLLYYAFGAASVLFIVWRIVVMQSEIMHIYQYAYKMNIDGAHVWTFSAKQAWEIKEFFPKVEEDLHGDKNVFVYPYCPLIYVLFDFNNPTFTDLIPTFMNVPDYGDYSFNRIKNDIMKDKTNYIICCNLPQHYINYVLSLEKKQYHVNVLDEYISAHYISALRVNNLILYKKR
jgi:hypothetical protein